MTPISKTPGRKLIRGQWKWVAREDARKRGFTPRTAALPEDQATHEATCKKLWADMLDWLADGKSKAPLYDGSIASLSQIYQMSDASPYHGVEPKTQRGYSNALKTVCSAVGQRRIDALTGDDFRRWHKNWLPRGVRSAQEFMKVLRIIMNYGAEQRLHGCATAADILSRINFQTSKKRNVTLDRNHVEAIIEIALGRGDHTSRSVALCQAIQFETTLRQTDVIGIWRPKPLMLEVTPEMHVTSVKYWSDGVTFERLATGYIRGESNKEGVPYDYPLHLMPITTRILDTIPERDRKGAACASSTGIPMSDDLFRKTWRRIANLAGVPKEIWNRDTRSGGITEATDIMSMEHARHLAGHSQAATTAGYSRHKSERIASAMKLRLEHGNRHGNGTVTDE